MEFVVERAQDSPCHRGRLVTNYKRTLNPDANCLSESITEPTEAEIQKLFSKTFPKLRRVLRTPQSVYRFIELLSYPATEH